MGLLGAAAACPLAGRAQQLLQPVIGFLHSASPNPRSSYWVATSAFRQCLGESGFIDGQNATIDFRWAEDRYERLPTLASDLVRRNVSLIFAGGGDVAALAAKNATSEIPIVFAIGADPVKQGIVTSFNRPGANITGVTFLSVDLRPKTLELARELLPRATTIAVLANPDRPNSQALLSEVMQSARSLGLKIQVLKASNEHEIDSAFAMLHQTRVDALVVLSDPVFFNRADQIARLEIQNKIPSIHSARGNVVAGSLMSYGASIKDAYCRAGSYAAVVLKGEKPGDLPIVQADKFELVINLKTAKEIELPIPPSLLNRADEVIE
jgi:ABC-type uncharacterized transport system substrate-binding protein